MAHFVIKNKFQKRPELYQDILTPNILADVCQRITGSPDYTVEFDNSGYNKGRLAKLQHGDASLYISFSENEATGRNSSFQSFPSALSQYHKETNPNKRIYFYFLSTAGQNIETPYFLFMYRLMKTAGATFLNEDEHLNTAIIPFNSVEDIIAQRNLNRERNRGNNSTYVTVDENNTLQIYGKTYGANKYETALLCLAISKIATTYVELYEIAEGGLEALPASAREVIAALGNITIITSDAILERTEFENNDSLRSPAYIYNLLEKLGDKKCALCNCEIPQIIQGAHIWPVASIKKATDMSPEQKLASAIDADNGIWLCNNHHKLFDINWILINKQGQIKVKPGVREVDENYLAAITLINQIGQDILTPQFLEYLERRNNFG